MMYMAVSHGHAITHTTMTYTLIFLLSLFLNRAESGDAAGASAEIDEAMEKCGSKGTLQAKAWFFTLNNPDEEMAGELFGKAFQVAMEGDLEFLH